MRVNQTRDHLGEIGYFVDSNYWGKGIATRATKLIEKWGFNKLKLKRIEIMMNPKNKASEKIAIKCGYKKEGLMKKALHDGKEDAYLYAKVRN